MKRILFSGIILIILSFNAKCFAQDGYVKIGDQYWSSTNLNVSKFNNGDEIRQITDNKEWQNAGSNRIPAWCYFNNDPLNESKYGKLYNLWAVIDPRGIAPTGWHVATKEDCENLMTSSALFVDVFSTGQRIENVEKYLSKTNWKNNKNGTNQTGLTISPSGRRNFDGGFSVPNASSFYWTTTMSRGSYAHCFDFYCSNPDYSQKSSMNLGDDTFSSGFAVRCVSNNNPPSSPLNNSASNQTVSSNSQNNTNTSIQSTTSCTYKFVKPTNLTYKYVDNRKYCCYCREKYAEYTLKTNMVNHEQALYISEKLYQHIQQIGADDEHKKMDMKRMIDFLSTTYPGFENLDAVSYATIAWSMFPLYGLEGKKLGETVRVIDKYNLKNKFCSPKCENECNSYNSCKCN